MPDPVTADTITNAQIRTLRKEARAAGDHYQAGLCDLAQSLERATDMTTHEARQACADTINEAAARDTRPTQGTPADVGASVTRDR